MLKFSVNTNKMKTALDVVTLATADAFESILTHALFRIDGDKIHLRTTDSDRIGIASCSIENVEGDTQIQFTAAPKKLSTLLKDSDTDQAHFVFEDNMLRVYVSNNDKAYTTFPSFKPEEFLLFEEELSKFVDLKTVNAGVFLTGIRFISGFLPQDDKNKRFAGMYMTEGVLYGSNGSNKIGAFENSDFKDLESLFIRRVMLSDIVGLIEKTDTDDVAIKSSSKMIGIFSPDGLYGFGFLKPTEDMSKFPMAKITMTLDRPSCDGFNIDKGPLIKKLNRMAVTADADVTIKFDLLKSAENTTGTIEMSTVCERPSTESTSCKRLSGTEDFPFALEYRFLKGVLGQFQASNIDIYVDTQKCTIISEAEIEIEGPEKDKPIRKPFKEVAFLSVSRIISEKKDGTRTTEPS